jgi:hypothetical protein
MPREWQIPVQRSRRYGVPIVWVRFNRFFDAPMVVSGGEPRTSILPQIAEGLTGRGGRIVIPSDVGPLIARTLTLESIALLTTSGESLALSPFRVAITSRAQALGAGGMLGIDVFSRFFRFEYRFGPPDLLILEEP